MQVSRRRFEQLVADELDALPAHLLEAAENVAVVVADRASPEQLVHVGSGVATAAGSELLGLYEGSGTKPSTLLPRGWAPTPITLPDVITLFREPLCALAGDEDALRDHIHATLVHEFAHHFGVDDDQLDALGW